MTTRTQIARALPGKNLDSGAGWQSMSGQLLIEEGNSWGSRWLRLIAS